MSRVVVAVSHPHLVEQLVDPAQADRLSAGSHRRVELRCDGVTHGHPPHPECVYRQMVFNWTAGMNGCPRCRMGGTDRSVQSRHPDLAERLVDEVDRARGSSSRERARVWCDGTAQGGQPHDRVVYEQLIFSLTAGANGCPLCGPRRRVSRSPR